jgi:hypothetical protein
MTPQQLKAMKLALEALKTSMYPQQKQLQAITAIEEALKEHAMQEVQRLGQEIEQCQCTECQIKPHASDCAVHSEPAYPKGKCDCGAQPEQEPKIGCVNHDCDQCKAQPEQEPVIGKWSLREVYFDEDGEPISHRSPPQRTEQEPVAWHTNSPSDPEICNERSAQACGPVYCGDSGGYCNKCPKQKTIQAVKPCKGMNCGCTDGRSHSLECLAELAAALGIKENQ